MCVFVYLFRWVPQEPTYGQDPSQQASQVQYDDLSPVFQVDFATCARDQVAVVLLPFLSKCKPCYS